MSLTSGSGQTAGDAVASIETDLCGGGQVHNMITALSTVTMDSNSDWDSAASQSLYGTLEFALDCNTIPTIAIIGSAVPYSEGRAVTAVCSGCASSGISTSSPATKVQASVMSILLLGLLVIGIGQP